MLMFTKRMYIVPILINKEYMLEETHNLKYIFIQYWINKDKMKIFYFDKDMTRYIFHQSM